MWRSAISPTGIFARPDPQRAGMAGRAELQLAGLPTRCARRVDRLNRRHAWCMAVQDCVEQPLPDPARNTFALLGLAPAGSGDAAIVRRLATGGTVMARRPSWSRHLRTAAATGARAAARPTGSIWGLPKDGADRTETGRAKWRASTCWLSVAAQLAQEPVRAAGVGAPAADTADARAGRVGRRGIRPLPPEQTPDAAPDDDGA